jgi:uncharacterized repeat protein (TIGR01451 family)
MKNLLSLLFFSVLLLSGVSRSQTPVEVKDSIVGNVTWTSDKTYLIKGFLYVVNGATLTIQPGTLIMGDKASKGTLIIERGGKIIAQGTPTRPIVFTSQLDPGTRQAGDWGGVIICGKAPINVNNTLNGGAFTGGEAQIEGGPRSKYGGSDPNDYSGILSYVRIEFSGIALSPNNETNSLTMAGVGSYTQIDHVQVSYGGDDGFEWFGGTVNAKYLINIASLDDDWDTDFGWQGKVQFAVSQRDPNVADVSGSNGFESDNNNPATFANPRTKSRLSNFTVIGPQSDTSASFNALYRNGAHFRRNSQQCLYNSIVMGWPGALLMDGTGVTNGATNDSVQIRNTIFAGLRQGRDFTTNSGNPFNCYQWFSKTAYANRGFIQPSEVMLEDPFNRTAPNWTPKTGSSAASGANFTNPNLNDPFFMPTTYVGAFDPNGTRWDAGWAEYNPVTANYSPRPQGVVAEVNFGNIGSGKTKDSAVVIVRNAGFGSLTITAANVTGSQFSTQGLTLPFTLLGGETKTITIRYAPTDTNIHTGSISFESSNGSAVVNLKGKGTTTVVPAPGVSIDYSSLDFALVPVGENVTYNVTITNTGTADLNLSNFRITGTDAGSFSITNGGTNGTLAPAAKRTVSIKFTPPAIGDRTATFSFDHNATGSPKNIPLKGKGIEVPDATVLEGEISSNVTLTSDKKWLLRGFVYVVDGGVLNIEPGTLIIGEKSTKGTLIVERGGKINAEGTAKHPIIFSSQMDPGQRSNGDWGGILLCGKAPINVNNTLNGGTAVGGEAQLEGGPRSKYGGNNPSDSSGVLRYVRIEFPGIALSPNNETNGLTLAGVGNRTVVDNIHVSYGGDDAFEWFGGTVNAKHLIGQATLDDCWDTDFGWSGMVQFGVSISDPNIADVSGSNGFESDNNNPPSFANPRTQGVFSNMSVVGPQSDTSAVFNSLYRNGGHIRRNSQQSIYNSIIMGWPGALIMDGTGVTNGATADTVQIRNTIFAGLRQGKDFTTNSGNSFNTKAWVSTPAHNNSLFTQPVEVMLENPFVLSAPNFTPKAGSPALSGGEFTSGRLTDPFFEKVTYRGAFGTTRWDEGWTNYDPKTTVYASNATQNVTAVNFGKTKTDSQHDSVVAAVVKNTGNLTARVTGLTIVGSTEFEVIDPVGAFNVLGGESRDIKIRFKPTSVGVKNAKLQVAISGGNPFEVDLSGEGIASGGVNQEVAASGLRLMQNIPNPAEGNTVISFFMPNGGDATLEILDITGKQVSVLANGYMMPGEHSVIFSTVNVAKGVYIYRLRSGNEYVTKSMVIVK